MPALETIETARIDEEIELICCSYNFSIDLLEPIVTTQKTSNS